MSALERSSREVDPLLRDLSEKKQSFRRNVVSLAAELKEVRSRLASQQQSIAKEALNRQKAEIKAMKMEEEISSLEKSLEERNLQLQTSTSASDMYAKELDNLKLQLLATSEAVEVSARSAQSAQLQCSTLVRELEKRNDTLKDHENRVNKLGQQLSLLQKDIHAREFSQTQLRDEVNRIEDEIMHALTGVGANNDCELRKILEEVSPRNLAKMNKLLNEKDEEITKLRDDIRVMSSHWKVKAEELDSQLEKHHRVDQETKKKVLKLEFCLQEVRSQTRKLQRMDERRDKALKEVRDEIPTKQVPISGNDGKRNFWDTPSFRIAASMSMLIMVMFSRR